MTNLDEVLKRVASGGVIIAFSLPLITGCNANIDKRELLIDFKPGATQAQEVAAEKACTGIAPDTSPESEVPTTDPEETSGVDRFLISHADDKDIAELESCLGKQPGVQGFNDTNDSE